MNNPQPSSEESGFDFHINCCSVYQYARSPSDVKPLPPSTSTAPLALEERVSSTRSKSKGSNLSRAASTHDGEQPNIDVQRSTSAKADAGEEEEEGPEADKLWDFWHLFLRRGQVSDIQPSRTRSVQSQRGVEKSHSMDNTQSDSFASVQGGDEENIDNNSNNSGAVIPFGQDECQGCDKPPRNILNPKATKTKAKWLISISTIIMILIVMVVLMTAPPMIILFAPSNTVNYEYYRSENSECSLDNESNWQGPTPRPNDTVLQFFASGDAPYDDEANTCIGEDGLPQIPCTRYDCTRPRLLPRENTCTYEGSEYRCLKDNIIPYMNDKVVNGDAAFALHVGDFIKGDKFASNNRCSEASFESRKTLFNQCTNLLIAPGDNEWNECAGYDINSNNDEIRQLWRDKFANEKSPFHQFRYDFPSTLAGTFRGDRPHIIRHYSNPEILFFTYNDIGIFGLNIPAGGTYINVKSSVDINAQWVEDKLDKDRCDLKSIILFGHASLSTEVEAKLQDYYNACSSIPTLFITGNDHPSTYCMKRSNNRFTLTVEAFQSGPLLVSIVHDKDGNHYFHVNDKDLVDSNGSCPDYGRALPRLSWYRTMEDLLMGDD